MAWYHWVAGYLIIIGGILFTVISPKPLWLWGVIAVLIISGLILGILLPHKPDKLEKELLEQKKDSLY